jgi:uncharacterized protein YndB with AHSA1/START domain
MTFASPDTASRELVITRLFRAPRAAVWRAWTDPVQAVKWWGPKEYPATHLEMDLRVGGVWRGRLYGVDDQRVLTHRGVFHEIRMPERLVFTFAWDEAGERGLETLVTIDFTDAGDNKTRMLFRQSPFQSDGERDGHSYGWNSTFDRLDTELSSV